jgi:hypothetical protein
VPRSPDASPPNSLTHHDDAADHLTSWTATTDTGADFTDMSGFPPDPARTRSGYARRWQTLIRTGNGCTSEARRSAESPWPGIWWRVLYATNSMMIPYETLVAGWARHRAAAEALGHLRALGQLQQRGATRTHDLIPRHAVAAMTRAGPRSTGQLIASSAQVGDSPSWLIVAFPVQRDRQVAPARALGDDCTRFGGQHQRTPP